MIRLAIGMSSRGPSRFSFLFPSFSVTCLRAKASGKNSSLPAGRALARIECWNIFIVKWTLLVLTGASELTEDVHHPLSTGEDFHGSIRGSHGRD